MKKKIINTIWVMGVLALAGFCLSACNHELDIQQAYPFTVETMPVQKHIVKGQTAEIRCTLKRQKGGSRIGKQGRTIKREVYFLSPFVFSFSSSF